MDLSSVPIIDDYHYQFDDCILLPFVPGKPGFPDDFLVTLYLKMQVDGLLDLVFTGMTVTMTNFLTMFQNRVLLVGFSKEPYTVRGLGWIWQIEGEEGARKANVGFAFFKESWGVPCVRRIAHLAIEWWFREALVDVIFGLTRKDNYLAKNFCRKHLSFKKVADIPYAFTHKGKFLDGTLVYVEKNDFLEGKMDKTTWAAITPDRMLRSKT